MTHLPTPARLLLTPERVFAHAGQSSRQHQPGCHGGSVRKRTTLAPDGCVRRRPLWVDTRRRPRVRAGNHRPPRLRAKRSIHDTPGRKAIGRARPSVRSLTTGRRARRVLSRIIDRANEARDAHRQGLLLPVLPPTAAHDVDQPQGHARGWRTAALHNSPRNTQGTKISMASLDKCNPSNATSLTGRRWPAIRPPRRPTRARSAVNSVLGSEPKHTSSPSRITLCPRSRSPIPASS